MQLGLTHLSAYLPYGISCVVNGYANPLPLIGAYNDDQNGFGFGASLQETSGSDFGFNPDEFKLILRPITGLTKEIEHRGEKVVASTTMWYMFDLGSRIDYIDLIHDDANINNLANILPYECLCYLLSLHFDVFGLIKEDLAVDFNSLKRAAKCKRL